MSQAASSSSEWEKFYILVWLSGHHRVGPLTEITNICSTAEISWDDAMTNWNSIIRPGTNYFRPKFRVNNGKEFQCSFQDIHHSTLDSNTLQLYTNVLLISTVGADGKILLKYSGEKIQNVKYVIKSSYVGMVWEDIWGINISWLVKC